MTTTDNIKSEYEIQAEKFLADTKTEFKAEFKRNGSMPFDKEGEVIDIYIITFKRGNRKFSFEFGQSIMNSQYYQDTNIKERTYTLNGGCRTGNYKITDIEKYISGYGSFNRPLKLVKGILPTAYDVLTCLTKYDPGTFEDFCSEFGYDEDSRSAKKTYKAIVKEYEKLCSLFDDKELDQLREIQ